MSTKNQFPVLLNVDISETDSSYLIEANIKGFKAENVKVSTWEDSLVIEMETGHEPSQSYYLGELEPEHYRRVIPLGFPVQEDHLSTQFTDGTLKIRLHKPSAIKRTDRSARRSVA